MASPVNFGGFVEQWRGLMPTCHATSFFSIGLLLIAVLCFTQWITKWRRLHHAGIPLIPKPRSNDFRAVLAEANAKYPDRPYMVSFKEPTIVIPRECVEELKNLSDSYLSTNGSQYDRWATRWTNSGWVTKELAHSMKYDLANEVDDFFPAIQRDIQHSAANSLPCSGTWVYRNPQEALVNIVAPVIGTMMVGSPLNQDKKWLSSSINHAMAVVTYSAMLRCFPSIFRPVVAHLLPQKRVVEESKKGIEESIRGIIQEHVESSHSLADKGDSPSEERGRLVRWLLKRYKPRENPQFCPSLIARAHYSLCFAAIHSPTFLLLQAIIDLASYPQYVAPLRAEINRELANAPVEAWTRETVARLTLLDAFCKESARINPQGLIAWMRKTHRPIALASGVVLPANALIATINPAYDARITSRMKDANKFYPERWMEVDRTDPNPHASFRFGCATTDSLIFGYGKHACPGRPLGVTMVKDILAHIVSGWDVRVAGGKSGRPENRYFDFFVVPPIHHGGI